MSTARESIRLPGRIVVGVDGSEPSKDALAWAAGQARVTGATLAVISTWEDTSIWGRSAGWLPGVDPQTDTAAALDETIREALGSEHGVDLTKVVKQGHAAPILLEESKTASLVVVGHSGHGEFAGMLLGSVSAFLVTHANCPVAIIRDHGGAADEKARDGRIVVGIDGSSSSHDALAWAATQAELTRAPLTVIITWHLPTDYGYMTWWPEDMDFAADATSICDQAIDEVLGADRGTVTAAVVQGHPSLVLVDESETAALLVVGCRGHGEFAGMLLGSVSEFVAAHAHCPVIIVRGDAEPLG